MPDQFDVHADLAGFLLGSLDEAEAAAFATHLEECPECQAELDDLSALPGLIDGMLPVEPLPADLEARTFAAIEAEVRSNESADAASAPVVPITAARATKRWTSRQMILSVAAAVIVVAGAFGAGLGITHHGPATQTAALAVDHLVAPNGGAGRGTATIRATETGLTIDLSVHGLPPSPPGTFYTCWLVGPGDTLAHQDRVSVGSFVVGADGSANVVWNTGASLQRFPTLGVTLEPSNGDPLHQGPKVLENV